MVRAVATRILGDLERGSRGFATERIHQACQEKNLKKRERGFLTELVLGVLRHRRTLDAILAAYSRVPLDELERAVLQSLRLGLYQLLYLDGVPAFAAIHETVAQLSGPPRRRSFVNGVLRAMDRQIRRVPLDRDRGGASETKRLLIRDKKVCFFSRPVFPDPEQQPAEYLAAITNHPAEMVQRWLDRWGRERCEELLHRNNRPAPLFVRANLLGRDREHTLEQLRGEGIRCLEGKLPESIVVAAPAAELVRSKAFRSGRCTVQDETAMAIAPLLGPEPHHKYLDLCAAPGGKATHLAELSGDQAQILAVDREESRVDRLKETVLRLGVKSVSVVQADARDPEPFPAPFDTGFDGVLLDAPCSNSGVLRRRPEARDRLDAKHLETLRQLQGDLLKKAAARVAPGGKLLYSTCSIEDEENTQQVRRFLESSTDFALIESHETLPEDDGGDGGYASLLERAR